MATVTVGGTILLPAIQRVDRIRTPALGIVEVGHRGVDRGEQLVVAVALGVVIGPVVVAVDRALEIGGLRAERVQAGLELADFGGVALQHPAHRLVILTGRGADVLHRRGHGQ